MKNGDGSHRINKQPWVGGVGCLGILFGFGLAVSGSSSVGVILLIAGLVVLVFALATGKITLFG